MPRDRFIFRRGTYLKDDMKTCLVLTFVLLAWTGWVDHEVHGSPLKLEVNVQPAEEATPEPAVDTTKTWKFDPCYDPCFGAGNPCCTDPKSCGCPDILVG